ncbi:MAG: TetR/AcrR family transcriptional regulator [Cyclobacteriaceae bacterium]
MKTDSKTPWIVCGYQTFAKEGPNGLKIEVIAREVNKNKSSFYHHFADLNIFMEVLLDYHMERAKIISSQEALCKNVVPDLLNLLVTIKTDLLFNRQLRINRTNEQFKSCFQKSSRMVGESILDIWAEMLGLTDNSDLARMVLNLSIENFYLQITEETLTYEWLENYMAELKNMSEEFNKNVTRQAVLNGSV